LHQVKRILTDTSFIALHEDFKMEFVVSQIDEEEELESWLNMHTHTNIVTAYDVFVDEFTGKKFQMVEQTNGGSLF